MYIKSYLNEISKSQSMDEQNKCLQKLSKNFYTTSENPPLQHGLETGLPYIDKPEYTFNPRKKNFKCLNY